MALDDVHVPEPGDPEDLLAAWRGQVNQLDSSLNEERDGGSELLIQLRAIADDLAGRPTAATPLLPAAAEQAEVLSEAIAVAETATIGDDTALGSPFDFAALTTAVATLEGAASNVLARAEGEFADVRESVKGEVVAIRETLAIELKGLREEFQKSHRRAARRSANGPRVLSESSETPVLAKLNDACSQLEALQAQTARLAEALPAADSIEARVRDELNALAEARAQHEAAVEACRTEFARMCDEMRGQFAAALSAIAASNAEASGDAAWPDGRRQRARNKRS